MNKYNGKGKFSITFFIVLAMVVQIVAPSILNITFAEDDFKETEILGEIQDEGGEDEVQSSGVVEENLLSNFSMTIIDNYGAKTEVNIGDVLDVDLNNINAVQINYGLTKPDEVTIVAGDIYTIDLPAFFEGTVIDKPITIGGTQVATYSIIDGQVVITFNEAVNSFDNTEMFVELSGSFDTEVFENVEEVVVYVPFRDETSFTATIRPEQQEYQGEDNKTAGTPYVLENGEKVEVDRNPTHVDWTVIANDGMKSYEDATIIDKLGDNLKIVKDSIEVYRIIRNYKNKEIDRELVNVIPTITDSGFEIDLGPIEDAYEITYTTELIRPDGGGVHTINNTARIILDGSENPVSGGFEGTWSGDLPVISKDGELSDDNPNVIDWEVKYNFGKEELGTVSLTDVLTHGEVDVDSVVVLEVDVDIDGNIIGEGTHVDVTPDKTDNGMMLPELDANGRAYLITFLSTVPVGLNDTVINTISDNLTPKNSDDAKVPVNTIPTGGKVGKQSVDDNGRPYIDWTITMNPDKINVGSITVRDVFNKDYLKFDVDDLSLYKLYKDGVEATNFTIDNYTHKEDGRTGFKLNVTKAGPHEYKFVYRTYYTTLGMQQPELANNAELIFKDGEGNGIGPSQPSIKVSQTGPKAGINKSGDYVLNDEGNQEIEWTVTFNTSNILLDEESKLIDNFISKNYKYIDESLEVTGISDDSYTFTLNTDGDGFIIEFGLTP